MKRNLLNFIIIIIDIFLLIAIFYLSVYVREYIGNSIVPEFNSLHINDFLFVIIITIFIMYYEQIYTERYDYWQETYKVLKSLFLAYFITLALLTLTKYSLEYSRLFITLYFITAIIFIPIFKRFVKRAVYSSSFFKKKVLLIGNKEQIDIFAKEFKDNWYLGLEVRSDKYDTVIISSQDLSLDEIDVRISKYLKEKSAVYVVPYVTSVNFAHSKIMEYSNIRLNTIAIENKLLIKRSIYIKYIFDVIVTIAIMPLFFILHLIISSLIRLDSSGSIFFKQHRLGKDDKDFLCYKYRTMYENSDKLLEEYLQNNPDEVLYYEEYHKYKKDPRITKVGAFLRKTSLDELAQLVNVLKNEMSFVGPRPYMLKESCKLGDNQEFILKVKPGITGLWQVSGRNNLTFKERNELEVWYIKNWSLWADFVIMIKTIKVVFYRIGVK